MDEFCPTDVHLLCLRITEVAPCQSHPSTQPWKSETRPGVKNPSWKSRGASKIKTVTKNRNKNMDQEHGQNSTRHPCAGKDRGHRNSVEQKSDQISVWRWRSTLVLVPQQQNRQSFAIWAGNAERWSLESAVEKRKYPKDATKNSHIFPSRPSSQRASRNWSPRKWR